MTYYRQWIRAVMIGGSLLLASITPGLASSEVARSAPTSLSAGPEAIYAALEAVEAGLVPARAGVGLTLDTATRMFYEQRQFAPAWQDPRLVEDLLSSLAAMTDDGLDPEDYALSRLRTEHAVLAAGKADGARRAAFDVLATRAFIHALFHLNRGKLDPEGLAPREINGAAELHRIIDGLSRGDVTGTFALARPQNPLYGQLRDGLRQLRQQAAAGGWPQIGAGPTLKPGDRDPRVPQLRKRLAASGYLPAETSEGSGSSDADLYDVALAAAVRAFQADYYLETDSAVGPATRAALDVPVAARIDQIRVNLERARELLDGVVGEFVLVDIAGYKVSYYRDSKLLWRSRVQVGQPFRQTPEFKSHITYITLNPTWTVPPTILKNDLLPKVRRNINYLAEHHMRVLNAQGQEIPPAQVNWNNPRGITIRQDAGPWGALGQVAIRFPNPYAVYLHDTPNQGLFDKSQRDFSSGCIRTERPFELVYLMFRAEDEAARAAIDTAVKSGKTQTMSLPSPVPLMLIYWTVDVQADGRITFKPDIYRRDAAILARLNQPDRL